MDKYITLHFDKTANKRWEFGKKLRGVKVNGERPVYATIHGITGATIKDNEVEYIMKEVHSCLKPGGMIVYEKSNKTRDLKKFKVDNYE